MHPYCKYCLDHPDDELNGAYHSKEYGFPLDNDNALVERLILEINQAGLSWITILKKAPDFREAFDNFNISAVANYTTENIESLLSNQGIIRNRKKIEAAIHNAGVILELQKTQGSFGIWLNQRVGLTLDEWSKEFKNIFKFTGPEIVKEFLWSTGYLEGAHSPDCEVYDRILNTTPPWLASKNESEHKTK